MGIKTIDKISTTCTSCNTEISITEPNFRTVCEEHLYNIKQAISKIYEFNNSVNDVNEILKECDDITI